MIYIKVMEFIERREIPTKALAKYVKRCNIRLIYITGPIGIGKGTFSQRLMERLERVTRHGLTINADVRHFKLDRSAVDSNIYEIFKELFELLFPSIRGLNLQDLIKNDDIKNTMIIIALTHMEELLQEPFNCFESIKKCLNLILDSLPNCYIILTSSVQVNIIDEVSKR